MELKDVRTRDQFIEYLIEHFDAEHLNQKPSDAADWFIAVVNARMIFDSFTTKDLASSLLEGVQPMRYSDDAHADFFASYFEETDAYAEAGDLSEAERYELNAVTLLEGLLRDHFGVSPK